MPNSFDEWLECRTDDFIISHEFEVLLSHRIVVDLDREQRCTIPFFFQNIFELQGIFLDKHATIRYVPTSTWNSRASEGFASLAALAGREKDL
jgi:hypothetical protein